MSLNLQASAGSSTYTPDQLVAGSADEIRHEKVTLVSGENRTRGAVLGRIATAATVGDAVGDATNQASIGAITLGDPAFGADVKAGTYRIVCIEPASNGGRFAVEDPDGIIVGAAVVGTAFDGPIKFTIADGSTDFVAGDAFSITVSAITWKYKLSAAAATDGSQTPRAVLAQDCDASDGDTDALIYIRGTFNDTALTFGSGHTADSTREVLRAHGIYLIHGQAA